LDKYGRTAKSPSQSPLCPHKPIPTTAWPTATSAVHRRDYLSSSKEKVWVQKLI